jgi:hypothetical protein
MGMFENACRPSQNDPAERVLVFSLPRPRPPPTRVPKKNHPQPTQNAPPIKFPHYQCAAPGIEPMDSPHPRIQCIGPLQRIHTQNEWMGFNNHLKKSVHSDRTNRSYLNPLSDSRVRSWEARDSVSQHWVPFSCQESTSWFPAPSHL